MQKLAKYISFSLVILLSSCSEVPTEIVEIKIENNKFYPEKVEVSSSKRIKLVIQNNDNSIEEFESFDLNREKLIPGKQSVNIYVGPLKPGIYNFFGEFNPKTATGKLISKEE